MDFYPVAVILQKTQHTNNNTIKQNTAHKTTHTIKDTLHRMNTNNHNYNYIYIPEINIAQVLLVTF
jgi:hypothetical protein